MKMKEKDEGEIARGRKRHFRVTSKGDSLVEIQVQCSPMKKPFKIHLTKSRRVIVVLESPLIT